MLFIYFEMNIRKYLKYWSENQKNIFQKLKRKFIHFINTKKWFRIFYKRKSFFNSYFKFKSYH